MTIKTLLILGALTALLALSPLLRTTDAPAVTREEFDALKAQIVELSLATAPRAPTGKASGNDVQLAAEVRELRAQLAALHRQIAVAHTPSREGPAAQPVPSTAPATQELSLQLDEILQRGPDTIEARRLAAELGPAITRSLPQRAVLRHIVCVTSVCRAEISYPSAEALQSFVETALTGAEASVWQGPTFVHLSTNPPPPQGEVTAMLYLARSGFGFETPNEG